MSRASSKGKTWFKEAKIEGCQFCGAKESDELKLQQAHIIGDSEEKSTNKNENILVLCLICAERFDYLIKPRIYRSLVMFYDGKVPESWKNAEGRLSKKKLAELWEE